MNRPLAHAASSQVSSALISVVLALVGVWFLAMVAGLVALPAVALAGAGYGLLWWRQAARRPRSR